MQTKGESQIGLFYAHKKTGRLKVDSSSRVLPDALSGRSIDWMTQTCELCGQRMSLEFEIELGILMPFSKIGYLSCGHLQNAGVSG
jgi:hypothetical protein